MSKIPKCFTGITEGYVISCGRGEQPGAVKPHYGTEHIFLRRKKTELNFLIQFLPALAQ